MKPAGAGAFYGKYEGKNKQEHALLNLSPSLLMSPATGPETLTCHPSVCLGSPLPPLSLYKSGNPACENSPALDLMRSTRTLKYSGRWFMNEFRLMMYTMKAICATTASSVSCAARRVLGHLMFLPWNGTRHES